MMAELANNGRLNLDVVTANGKTLGENLRGKVSTDRKVIRAYDEPMMDAAGLLFFQGTCSTPP